MEEIAAHAKVSKPIVYEHFGGKEGLYAVIVDREMRELTNTLIEALVRHQGAPAPDCGAHGTCAAHLYRRELRRVPGTGTRLADHRPGRIVQLAAGRHQPAREDMLTAAFKRRKLSAKGVPYYAQMLVGMTVFTGQYWADRPKVNKEQLAAYIVDLAWHGLSRLDSKPPVVREPEGEAAAAKEDKERRDKERSDTGSPEPDAPVETAEPDEPSTCPRAPEDHQNRAQAGSKKRRNGRRDLPERRLVIALLVEVTRCNIEATCRTSSPRHRT